MTKIDELIILHGESKFAPRNRLESWFKRLENEIPVAIVDHRMYPRPFGQQEIQLFTLSSGKFAVISTLSKSDENLETKFDSEIELFPGNAKGLELATARLEALCDAYEKKSEEETDGIYASK